jgi:AcrR family transcriptional regulator
MAETPTTKERLLNAACRIFAEKGFRDATVAEICERADANIAAVNYHFGDKERLYDQVWRHAFKLAVEAYPIDESLPERPQPEDYLYSFAKAILQRIFCEEESGLFAKLLYRELASPTLALERIATEALFPQTDFLTDAVSAALGKAAGEEEVRLCMNSIIGQCAFYNFSRPLREQMIGRKTLTPEEVEHVARHIALFSLGGLQEIQKC